MREHAGGFGSRREADLLPAAPERAHVLDEMPAGALDVPGDDARGAVGILALETGDEAAMLLDDRLAARPAEGETAADRAQRLAMPPPEIDGVPVVVAVIDGEVEAFVEAAIGFGTAEAADLDFRLDRLQPPD